jgi:uncharacterized membrane protein YtjA (UPF0391 family)
LPLRPELIGGINISFDYPEQKSIQHLNYTTMLRWSVIFFVVAIIAAIFGFGGIAEGAASIAQILFFIFLALFVITILFGASLFKK